MKGGIVKRLALWAGIICIVLAVFVFVFADGLRRWYSGLFFAVLGIVALANAGYWRRGKKE